MKIKKLTNGNVILIDGNGKEFAKVPSDWMLGRDLKNAPMYFYISPNGSNGGGVVLDWDKVTHLIKGGVETAWSGSVDELFTELSTNFFFKASGANGGPTSLDNTIDGEDRKAVTTSEKDKIGLFEMDYIIYQYETIIYAKGSKYPDFQDEDATELINTVLNTLVNGGSVLIKGKIDNVDIITIPFDNIKIRGEGKLLSCLKLKADADSFYDQESPELKGMFQVHGINGFEIQSIELDGNGQNQTWINNGSQINGPGCLSAVYVGNQFASADLSTNIILKDVYAHDFTMYGFYTQRNSRGTQILDCLSVNNYWNGATLLGEDDHVVNLKTYGSGDVGISIYGQRITLLNCYVGPQNGAYSSVSSRWGIAIEQSDVISKGHRIINCIVDGGTGFALSRGFAAQKNEDVYVENLQIRNSNQFGAYIEGSVRLTIVNSSIKSTSTEFTQGLVITDLGAVKSDGVKLIGNDVDFKGFGINVTSGAQNTLVINNTIKSESGDIQDAGIATVNSSNYSLGAKAFITGEFATTRTVDAMFGKRVASIDPYGNVTNLTMNGMGSNGQGTATARSMAMTNFYTRQRRLGRVGATTANANAGEQGNPQFSTAEGFITKFVFGLPAYNAAHQYSIGMSSGYSAAVAPSAEVSCIHMYADAGDTTWKIRSGGGTMSAPIDLGVNFPVNTSATDVYELVITVARGATTGTYSVKRLNTGDVATGALSSIPVGSSLYHKLLASNLATGTAAAIDYCRIQIITDY